MSIRHNYHHLTPRDLTSTENETQKQKKKPSPTQRINILMFLFGVFALLLAAQLIRHQIFGTVLGKQVAETPRKLRLRGSIVDVNGHPLAIQRFRYAVVASPYIMGPKTRKIVAKKLALQVGMSEQELLTLFNENDAEGQNVTLNPDIGPEIGEAIKAMDLTGIGVYVYPVRFHPEGTLASHVLGFVDIDNVGRYGLESYFDSFLVAPDNKILPNPTPHLTGEPGTGALPESAFIPSLARRDLILSLDRALQYVAETQLKAGIEKYKADSGVVIIMNPKNSAILAMAGYPNYNPDDYSDVPSGNIYINPAISEIYEPGSVFKLITFAAALNENIITPETKYQDTNKYTYFEQVVQNWDRKGRGEVTAQQALAQSLNVTTAKIAVQIGEEAFYKTVSRFGFGVDTGIDLAYEAGGIVHSPNKPNWVPGYLATNSFGQAISVTPLQMANAVAAIAAGGVLHRPYTVGMVIKGDQVRVKEPEPISRAISEESARTLTQMMIAAANHTKEATIPGYAIAGKTGTAEIPGLGGYKENRTITTFVGFFPADDPQFLILVKLVRPETSAWAGQTAAPVFREIAQSIINMYGIPPDDIRLNETP